MIASLLTTLAITSSMLAAPRGKQPPEPGGCYAVIFVSWNAKPPYWDPKNPPEPGGAFGR